MTHTNQITGVITGFDKTRDTYHLGHILSQHGAECTFDTNSMADETLFDTLNVGDHVSYRLQYNKINKISFVRDLEKIENPLTDALQKALFDTHAVGDTLSLADLGPIMDKHKIYYKEAGYPKLKDFLRQFPNFLYVEDKQVSDAGAQTFVTLIDKSRMSAIIEKPTETINKPETKANTYIYNSNREPLLFQ